MSTQCAETLRVVDTWVSSGEIASGAVERIRLHLRECESCARSVRPLVVLMERDAGMRAAEAVQASLEPAPDVVAKVLARVDATPARASARHARLPIMAAAVLLLAAGITLIALRFGIVDRVGQDSPSVVVRFELAAPEARSVFLVGDFTDWEQERLRLQDRDDDGLWEITIRLQKGRAYSYNFLIDGEAWVVDPGASLNVDDGFGGKSSVIVL